MERDGNGTTSTTLTIARRPPVGAKKRSGAMNLFRAVVLAFRSNSSKKSHGKGPTAMVDAGTIRTLVGTVRPLHHQIDYRRSPPPPPPPPTSLLLDSYYDVHQLPLSPSTSEGMSRYASAEDLQVLDTSEEENHGESDGEIDTKAEEFIAMFYKQIESDSFIMVEETECMLKK